MRRAEYKKHDEVVLDTSACGIPETKVVKITSTTWPNPYSKYKELVAFEQRVLHKTMKGTGIDRCFVCNIKFCPEDNVYLAIVDYKYSVLICQKCGSEIYGDICQEEGDTDAAD